MHKILFLLLIGVPVFYCTETLEKFDESNIAANNDSKSAPFRLSRPSGYSLKGKQVFTQGNSELYIYQFYEFRLIYNPINWNDVKDSDGDMPLWIMGTHLVTYRKQQNKNSIY